MQAQARHSSVGNSNIIYVDLGADGTKTGAPIRIQVARRTFVTEIVVNLLFVGFVAGSIWACAQQSIKLSSNRSLESFVERATNYCDEMTADRKATFPDRS